MKISSTAYLSDRDVITSIQTVNKNNTWNDHWNKKKTSISTGKLNNRRKTNTTINHNIVTYNVDVTKSKSLLLNKYWKIYDNNKTYCLRQSMWSNKILSFCSILLGHFLYNTILCGLYLSESHISSEHGEY